MTSRDEEPDSSAGRRTFMEDLQFSQRSLVLPSPLSLSLSLSSPHDLLIIDFQQASLLLLLSPSSLSRLLPYSLLLLTTTPSLFSSSLIFQTVLPSITTSLSRTNTFFIVLRFLLFPAPPLLLLLLLLLQLMLRQSLVLRRQQGGTAEGNSYPARLGVAGGTEGGQAFHQRRWEASIIQRLFCCRRRLVRRPPAPGAAMFAQQEAQTNLVFRVPAGMSPTC